MPAAGSTDLAAAHLGVGDVRVAVSDPLDFLPRLPECMQIVESPELPLLHVPVTDAESVHSNLMVHMPQSEQSVSLGALVAECELGALRL
jgi:hypothetical protein